MNQTPLHQDHLNLNAKMVDFGGWHMPVQYTSIIDEHLNTRKNIGLFDVSHMGEIEIHGPDALKFVQKIVTQDVSKSQPGHQAQYSVMCTPTGGIVDDILIYKLTEDHFLLCVNASNIEKDFAWILENKKNENVKIENTSSAYVQIAVQGPKAKDLISKLTPFDLSKIQTYRYVQEKLLDIPMIISRTGYTGEDGFELYLPADKGHVVWQTLLERGKTDGITPCGLGARDTLRLEACFPLYGHEIDEKTTPLEAGLNWVVKLDKENFIGKEALLQQKEMGLTKKLIAFELLEKGIPRQGYPLRSSQNELIGTVTSGTLSPVFMKGIGLGVVKLGGECHPRECECHPRESGDLLTVEIRNRYIKAKVVKPPFYRKKKERI
ncbi:MAG: hypothetical protein A3B70_06540 [Deltaproteobacteria bacterium RIFCSPHIGHO2_02_FULL_40_11]|nr:MAG: hypothetical protein A3B70_06540 [Deltaproteobacteria bacterium RIFCSPHIGHO2_02_FULL_40_11]